LGQGAWLLGDGNSDASGTSVSTWQQGHESFDGAVGTLEDGCATSQQLAQANEQHQPGGNATNRLLKRAKFREQMPRMLE
jgi:hypothetical protein